MRNCGEARTGGASLSGLSGKWCVHPRAKVFSCPDGAGRDPPRAPTTLQIWQELASILTKLSNGSLLSQAEANNESRTNRADITLREIAADGQDDYNVEESRLRRFLAVRKSAVKAEEAQTTAWKNSPEGTAALQRSSRSPSTPPSRSSTSSRKSTPSPSKRSSSGARKAGDSTRLFGTSISRSLDADLAKVESNI